MSRSKLTDAQVAEIRALVGEGGLSLSAIAERFGTSRQHVSRLARGEQRGELVSIPPVDVWRANGVASAVRSLLDRAGLDPNEDVAAATAVVLAEKLDQCREALSAQSAMAVPGIAKVLQDVLDDIRAVGQGGPRLGSLRGEEAVLVAKELGYPNPEQVDVPNFDLLEVLKLKRARRLANRDPFPHETPGNGSAV
jgi:transcriptional regulator with XRE-family HTH domain